MQSAMDLRLTALATASRSRFESVYSLDVLVGCISNGRFGLFFFAQTMTFLRNLLAYRAPLDLMLRVGVPELREHVAAPTAIGSVMCTELKPEIYRLKKELT